VKKEPPILLFDDPREIERSLKKKPDNFRILYARLPDKYLSRRLTACKFYPSLKKRRFTVGYLDSIDFNCHGFSMGIRGWLSPENECWWNGATKSHDLRAWVETLDGFGFRHGMAGKRKIALYVNHLGKVTHSSLMINGDKWASKIGASFAIFGHKLSDLEDNLYGRVKCVMSL